MKRDNVAGKASTRANQTFTRRMFHESESLSWKKVSKKA